MKRQTAFPISFVHMSDKLGRYKLVEANVKAITGKFPPATYPRVLDVCCGTGLYSRHLAEQGYDVMGIDLSVEQVAHANLNSTTATFQVGDMAYPPPGPFDLLLNTYSSFGYMGSIEEDQAVLEAWRKTLRFEGVLLMELSDMERARSTIGFPQSCLTRRTQELEEEISMNWQSGILDVTYRLNDEIYKGSTRIYEQDKLRKMLVAAGFQRVDFWGSFTGKSKEPTDRLIIAATA